MEINVLLPDPMMDSLDLKHSFTIRKIGYYERPKHPNMQRVSTREAMLILCMDGCGYVDYQGTHYEMKPGDLAFFEPDRAHQYGSRPDQLWTILWAHFTGEGVSYFAECLKKHNVGPVFHLKNYRQFSEELHYIIFILQNFSNSIDIHKACSLFQTAVFNLIEANIHKTDNDNHSIKQAVDFMKSNIYNTITLSDIADHLGITTSHMIRIFKQNVTITPMQYYYSLKLNEAIHLLQSTNLSVLEISQKLKYNNQFYFSQQFKKKMGVSPLAYKKSMNSQP